MPITRLGLSNPASNSDIPLVTLTDAHLVSVTVANKASTATPVTKVSVWVVPANAVIASQYAYICYNLEVGLGSSFETFRFGVVAGDTIYVRSSTSTTSFSCNGVAQEDSALAENIAQTFTNKEIRGINNTIYLEKGTTAERPVSAEIGYVRFNTELNGGAGSLEVLTGNGWQSIGMV